MKKTIIGIVIALVVVGGIGFVLAGNKKKIEAKKQVVDRSKIPVTVTTSKVVLGNFKGDMEFSGTLESGTDAEVVVTSPGKLQSFHVEKGMYVRKGQVLGSVDSEQLKLKLKALKLTESKLMEDVERLRILVDGKAAPSTNLKDLEYNLASTRVQMEQLEQSISDNSILAPISGQVITKNVEAGEYASPGMSLAKIVNISEIKVVVFINERHIYRINSGQIANIKADVLPGQSFQGKIGYISPVGDENHNYRVEVNLDAEGSKTLKAGTYVRVTLGTQDQGQGLQVPANALVTSTEKPSVYVVNGDKAKLKEVVTGRREGEMVEIVSGLQAGEEVIVAGQINLSDGRLIEVVE